MLRTDELAKSTGNLAEYEAFFKLYSKIVHPTSWSVNWPGAVSSDMYGFTLAVNAQKYGWGILKTVEDAFGIQAESCYEAAVERMRILDKSGKTVSVPVEKKAPLGTNPKIGRNQPCSCGSGKNTKTAAGKSRSTEQKGPTS